MTSPADASLPTVLYGRTGALFIEDNPGSFVGPSLEGQRTADFVKLGFGSPRELRVQFTIRKGRTLQDPPQAEIKIYNLAEQTRKRLDQARSSTDDTKRKQVQLEAGYAGTHSTVFVGDAIEIFSKNTGVDWVTSIRAVSGRELKRKHINRAFQKQSRVLDVLRTLITDATSATRVSTSNALALVNSGSIVSSSATYAKGISETGDPCSILDAVAASNGFEIWIDDNELVIARDGQLVFNEGVILKASTGLVGSPDRITDDRRPRALLVRAQSLLNPKLRLGYGISLDSSVMRGTFRVESVEHRGDTHGSEWLTEIEGVAL